MAGAAGGALKERARFLLEVIRAVRARVGDDYPVWCKIDSEEFYQDEGITLDDARQTAIWAEDAGADAIGVSAYYDGSRAAAHFSALFEHCASRSSRRPRNSIFLVENPDITFDKHSERRRRLTWGISERRRLLNR